MWTPKMSLILVRNNIISGQIIATSAEVTPNGGLVRESPQNALNSGLGIIVICPDYIVCPDYALLIIYTSKLIDSVNPDWIEKLIFEVCLIEEGGAPCPQDNGTGFTPMNSPPKMQSSLHFYDKGIFINLHFPLLPGCRENPRMNICRFTVDGMGTWRIIQ